MGLAKVEKLGRSGTGRSGTGPSGIFDLVQVGPVKAMSGRSDAKHAIQAPVPRGVVVRSAWRPGPLWTCVVGQLLTSHSGSTQLPLSLSFSFSFFDSQSRSSSHPPTMKCTNLQLLEQSRPMFEVLLDKMVLTSSGVYV